MRRRQQLIHFRGHGSIRILREGRLKPLQFLRTRRQPRQIEMQPPQQCPCIRPRRSLQTLLLQPRSNQGVNHRRTTFQGGCIRLHHRLKGPMRGGLLEKQRLIPQRAFPSRLRRPRLDRPLRALINPSPQHRNRLLRQHVLLGRHLHVRLQVRHEQNQRTLRALPRHNRRPIGTPAFQRRRQRVQPEPALLLVWPMAGHTMLRQHRMNVSKILRRPLHRFRQLRRIKRRTLLRSCRRQHACANHQDWDPKIKGEVHVKRNRSRRSPTRPHAAIPEGCAASVSNANSTAPFHQIQAQSRITSPPLSDSPSPETPQTMPPPVSPHPHSKSSPAHAS